MSAESPSVGASPHWESMWGRGLPPKTAFDNGEPSLALIQAMANIPSRQARALVPGAGRAYDAYYLATLGYDATAIDLSSTACAEANKWLEQQPPTSGTVTVVEGDFFKTDFRAPFDLIWDCTFLCALDIAARAKWAQRTSELLHPDGDLLSLVFPITDSKPPDSGPPFPLTIPLVEGLLTDMDKTETYKMENGTHMPRMPHFGNAVVKFNKK